MSTKIVIISERMAYNRKNKLQLIVDIQELTLEHTKRGVTQEWVYTELIYPRYRIAKSTYYNYLATTAHRDLRRIQEAEKLQQSLF